MLTTFLKNLVFFGIPKEADLTPERIERINLARTKVYFENTASNLVALFLGTILATATLYSLQAPLSLLGAWCATMVMFGWLIFTYEQQTKKEGFNPKNLHRIVGIRLLLGFGVGFAWGSFALLTPAESYLGFSLAFIAVSTLVTIGMLSFSVIPLQFFAHTLGAMGPLMGRIFYTYTQTQDSFYGIILLIVITWQVILLLKARTNSISTIRAIVLNEKLKDEVNRYAKAQKHIEYLAYHDHLTGAWNRRYFEGFLEDLLLQASQHNKTIGVLAIDIDRLKPINDQFGHQFGDELLVVFTKKLKELLPDQSLLARTGGDEFVVILPPALPLTSSSLAEQANTLCQALHTTYEVHTLSIPNSASIGYALFPHDAKELESLLAIADERMYENKRINSATKSNLSFTK